MGQETSTVMTRKQFAADIAIGGLGGLFFLVDGVLILAGVITVSGWGEGSMVTRIATGGLAAVIGLSILAGVVAGLAQGRKSRGHPGPAVRVARHGPFWAGVRAEDGNAEFGVGIGYPSGRSNRDRGISEL
jgi:hypothetical protein